MRRGVRYVPDDSIVIAAAGQLIPRKGHRFLLDADGGPQATQDARSISCIFGEGPLETSSRAGARHSVSIGHRAVRGFPRRSRRLLRLLRPVRAPGARRRPRRRDAESGGGGRAGRRLRGRRRCPRSVKDGETGLLVPPEDETARSARHRCARRRRRIARVTFSRPRAHAAQFSIDAMVDGHSSCTSPCCMATRLNFASPRRLSG